MMKRILAASALAALIASPALAANSVPGYSDDAQTTLPVQSYSYASPRSGMDSFAFAPDARQDWNRGAWNQGSINLAQNIGTDPDPNVRLQLQRGSVLYE